MLVFVGFVPQEKCQMLLLNDARPQRCVHTNETITKFGQTPLPNPIYSPDLAQSSCHLFGLLKHSLLKHQQLNDEALQKDVNHLSLTNESNFY
jgi:hypothetical protein